MGVSGDKTCALGRCAQVILHSTAQIITTLSSPRLWSHSAADPRDFAHVSEAPTSEWGHNGDMPSSASPFQPRSNVHTCSSWSSSSSLMTFLTFFKKMTRELSDIWKEEISQADSSPPRTGKQPYAVVQGSADFMGPLQPCGSRHADSSLNSCSGHLWRQSQIQG